MLIYHFFAEYFLQATMTESVMQYLNQVWFVFFDEGYELKQSEFIACYNVNIAKHIQRKLRLISTVIK